MSQEPVTCTTQEGKTFPCVVEKKDFATEGSVVFLFAIFCAYWAQATRRNAWLWFFLGLFFAPITGLVLLYKNSNDRDQNKT